MIKGPNDTVGPNRRNTAERITAAALQLFSQLGYDAATTAGIAKRAGVTEKTLFQHFGSKQELFRQTAFPALLRAMRPAIFDQLNGVLAKVHPTLAGGVSALMEERVRFAVEHPEIIKLLSQEILLRPEFRGAFVEHWKAEILPHALALFESFRSSGELRDLPAASVLRSIISVTLGYVITRTLLAAEHSWDDEGELRIMTDILLHGISARRP